MQPVSWKYHRDICRLCLGATYGLLNCAISAELHPHYLIPSSHVLRQLPEKSWQVDGTPVSIVHYGTAAELYC